MFLASALCAGVEFFIITFFNLMYFLDVQFVCVVADTHILLVFMERSWWKITCGQSSAHEYDQITLYMVHYQTENFVCSTLNYCDCWLVVCCHAFVSPHVPWLNQGCMLLFVSVWMHRQIHFGLLLLQVIDLVWGWLCSSQQTGFGCFRSADSFVKLVIFWSAYQFEVDYLQVITFSFEINIFKLGD